MSTRTLPPRPNLDQLKNQARELLQAHRDGHPSAAARVLAHHPKMRGLSLQEVFDRRLALADAQLAIAREYGFENWAALKHRVDLSAGIERIAPHPRFGEALAAFDAGDPDRLRRLLEGDPTLVHARTNLEPPYHYATGATLLHHVAGNPGRDKPLPDNVIELARVLLDAGADVNARTLGPNGGDTMGLLLTSAQASNRGFSGPLIDLLLERGARIDVSGEGALDGSLTNHAPRAAEKLIQLGAKPDVLAAAALGRMDLLRAFFDGDGRLLTHPHRHGREMTDRDAIGLAMLYAYVRRQREAVDFLLEKDGNWNMIGVDNGTALHRAAWKGDLDMVQRLIAGGADIHNRDNPFRSTPLAWAEHNRQAEVFQWIRGHCAIDLHDAVCFDLSEHVEGRLHEDPASVNMRVDQWDIPMGTALHWAAALNRVEVAKKLYERGAHRDGLAGNGMTPLDVAEARGAREVAALLDERGARRASEARSRASIRSGPLFRLDEAHDTLEVRPLLDERDWAEIIDILRERKIAGLNAGGQMTDTIIERVAELDHITTLELSGSKGLTDAGVQYLTRMPDLRRLELAGTAMTDSGTGALSRLDRLERVHLGGTRTGDGAIRALSGKPYLRMFAPGAEFTEAGLALLHGYPVFKTWQGQAVRYALMDFEAEPNYLMLQRGTPLARNALANLAGLDGLFALNLDHPSARPADLAPLMDLPNLGWLGHPATDPAMRQIGALPRLRFLMAQDTEAGDDGFVALSRSATLEYIWGRRCYNLTGRGFAALSTMPALRGLSVSCRNVDAAALAALPRFPALRELMPMDVQDEGFRHVGRCERLEALWCMYCRETTDAATEHICGLTRLKTYYAGRTKITDRSLQILAGMPSLEKLEFWSCAGITNTGAAHLAALPQLREVTFGDCRRITPDAAALFPPHVRVSVS
ncbi:MAG TPA: ankyrin repeat domain-containing protein [Vicinamibacterales bacterium]|nr:ankyrin repeat domain-containing protein [Vicinamibacterales bacterium]